MTHDSKKRGTSLKDGSAHEADHDQWSRRGFIHALGLAGGAAFTMGGFAVSAMAGSSSAPLFFNGDEHDRILVLIRLKGGNDGLNMIVPTFDYSRYINNRPTIGLRQSEVLSLNDKYAIPTTMQSLMPMWNSGAMKVINTVGYDQQNLSHFTSTDIWSTANRDIETDNDKSGWLGRYILDQNPDYLDNLPDVPGAIKISSGGNISYNNASQVDLAVNFNTPDRLLAVAENGSVFDTENLPDDCYYGEQVGFLRALLNVTYSYAPRISDAYNAAANSVAYANNDLARQLAIVARLIKGGLGTKLYMVTLNGFDTHENQNNSHPALMNALSTAVSAFYDDLAVANMDQNVLSMSVSEFGRRVSENSGGTDHGAAAPVLLFGPALDGNGILGDDPDLDDLDPIGNLKHSVDFRSIYATILEYWLCLDPVSVDSILGNSYDRLDGLGIACMPTSTADARPIQQRTTHFARPDGQGGAVISYSLVRPAQVNVQIYSILGQHIAQIYDGYQIDGSHEVHYQSRHIGLGSMPLIYRIIVNGKQYSGKFVL